MAAIPPNSTVTGDRLRGWRLVGWVLLLLAGGFPVLGAGLDLLADARTGLPADHTGTFRAVTDLDWQSARSTAPGIAHYVSLLEAGYALHELTFGLLFLVIVAIPFRRRQRWAWWAAWLPMIANLGYTLTFGAHDPTVLTRSLIADIALPVLLVANIPAFFPARAGRRAG